MTTTAHPSDQMVRAALDEILDPCSVAAGRPLGLVEMGLVQDLRIDQDGTVSILLRMTFPGCMMMPNLAGAAEERTARIPGVSTVEVDIDTAMTWTPAAMVPRTSSSPAPSARVDLSLGPIGGSLKEAVT